MAVKYEYTKADVNVPLLEQEITESSIVTVLKNITHIDGGSNNLKIRFDSTLSGGDETTLDGLVTAHNNTNVQLVPIYINLQDPNVTGTPTEDVGLVVNRGSSTNATLIWEESTDLWKAGLLGSEVEISLLGHSHTESDISDLGSYLTAEVNDLTAAVTWANVPNANITQGSVTQHEGALTITESQISDLGSYAVSGHNHDSDYVELTGDTMTGALTVTATTTVDQLVVKHSSNSQLDVTLDPDGQHGAAGFSISKGASGGGFMSLFPNSEVIQWIAGDPAAAGGANTFYIDTDNAGTFRINTLGGAGSGGEIVATSGAPLRPAVTGTSDLGTATYLWKDIRGTTIYGDGSNLTGLTESQISDLGNYAVIGGAHHDGFSDFVANEHIDWTSDQGATNIHANNITGYSATGHTHEGTSIDATAVTDGYVLTADGAGNAAWEASGSGVGGTSKQMNSWTLLSGSLYYNNFAHNLGTTEVTTFLYDTVSDREVRPEYTEIIDANTIRVVVEGNAEDLTCNVISGSGPAGPQGPAAEVIDDTTPQLGGNLDLNQKSIEMDPTPTSDDTGNGLIITATVDANSQGIGGALHVDTDGNWINADADSTATMPCAGVALESGTGSKKIMLYGIIRNDGWAWTTGSIIYVGNTSGTFTQTAPSGTGDQVQAVGVALSADVVYFNPDFTLVEVA